jgi:DUF4097 and DUF4098 domain-containing protein YvlB
MPSRNVVLATGAALSVLLAGSLAGCSVDTDDLTQGTESKQLDYRVTEPVKIVKVTAIAGRIEVVGADVTDVAVTEQLRFDDEQPATRHRVEGDTLVLDYTCPDDSGTCWVNYRVELPRGTEVNLHSDAGEIRMSGLTGRVQARTEAGVVVANRLRSQNVQVDSTAGSVTLGFATAPADVRAHTTAGSVTVKVPGDARYAVDASTAAGSTRVSVPEDTASSHRLRVSSSAGSVSVLSS